MAEDQLTMPLAVDMVLRDEGDEEAVAKVLSDGQALGEVIVRASRRFGVPLALPHMDLKLEKKLLLQGADVGPAGPDAFHFQQAPTEAETQALVDAMAGPLPVDLQAQVDAVRFVAETVPDLVPCAMTIGPFSLMTTLMDDPISAVYFATTGATAKDEPAVALLESVLDLSIRAVERSLREQLAAGARLAFVCEPAVNNVYLSPRQMKAGTEPFDRLVMANLERYRAVLDEHGADLFLHDCGELTPAILTRLVGGLRPSVLSLGSSEKLWEAAEIVPPSTVLYGNLPSKKFYSDDVINVDEVVQQARDLVDRMSAAGRPFILGTECDVLYVDGAAPKIWSKLTAMCEARGPA